MSDGEGAPNGFDARLAQRAAQLKANQASSLELQGPNPKNYHGGHIPNTPLAAALISFLLGGAFSSGLSFVVSAGHGSYWWSTWHIGFFISAWSAFHWAEFAVTAGWNRERCNVDSFLLDNGLLYHAANVISLFEYFLTLYFKPEWKVYSKVSLVGAALVVTGQVLRSTAMIHASTNFSHAVAFHKVQSHRLVTSGIYGWFRHPSYAGFYYWSLGTQVLLLNPVTFLIYVILLHKFFSHRVKVEEQALTRFFGDDYRQYRSRVGTKIPFVS